MESASELKRLIEKYEIIIQECQQKIIDAKRKQSIALQAMELLTQEGITDIELPGRRRRHVVTVPSLRPIFNSIGLGSAIGDILKSHPGEFLSAQDIYKELINGGFQSKSANIKRDVFVRLYRMDKVNALESKEEGGIKKYSLKQ